MVDHFDKKNNPIMVDVGNKDITQRVAQAEGEVKFDKSSGTKVFNLDHEKLFKITRQKTEDKITYSGYQTQPGCSGGIEIQDDGTIVGMYLGQDKRTGASISVSLDFKETTQLPDKIKLEEHGKGKGTDN